MPSLFVFTLTKMYNTRIHKLYPQHLTFANATKLQLEFVQYVHENAIHTLRSDLTLHKCWIRLRLLLVCKY